MRKMMIITMVCFLVIGTVSSILAREALKKITDNVYAYTDVKNASVSNSFGANAGIIIGQHSVAVVDTLDTAKEAREMISQIRNITTKPIRYVIKTHFHYDHALGNCEFERLGAVIVSHEKCRQNMIGAIKKMGLNDEQMAGTMPAYPSLVFSNKAMIDLGQMLVEMHFVAPGHSPDGILIFIPQEKVVFAGDNLFTNFHVFVGTADLAGWQKNLNYLMALDVDFIIPGHGPLSSKKDLVDQKMYLTLFDQRALELCAASDDLDNIVKQMELALPSKPQGQR